LTPGLGFGAIAAFDAFTAVAAFVTMGDDAERGASEKEDLGNAALRRAGRADPEDVTLGSSQKLRSQGTSTRYGNPDGRCIGQETAGRANGRASNRRQHAAAFCGRPGVHRAKRPAPSFTRMQTRHGRPERRIGQGSRALPVCQWTLACVLPLFANVYSSIPSFDRASMNSETHSTTPPASITIASRESRLAMWQAEHVRCALHKLYPSCDIKILGMTTRGDQILDRTLSKVGGKGLFVKELEAALADGRADLAVHSLKDVPMALPEGFVLGAILEREDPRDAFVSPHYESLEALPAGSIVGTSSLRREAMIRARFPELEVRPLRGNLDTRLSKLDRGEYAAIILAAAGLKRLGLEARIRALLDPSESLPAAGQGALGIEIRADRADLAAWLAPLHDEHTALAVEAERAVSRALGGSCEVPLATHAVWREGSLHLCGAVSTTDGKRVLRAEETVRSPDLAGALALGKRVSSDLEAQGAMDIVNALTTMSRADAPNTAPSGPKS
jgi:hydroxymethylbilane synthase